jgi:prepilin-type N-terminal cleavage/methylation domain-containing protein
MVGRRGFGLIEVVVALTLLSVALLGIAATATLSGRMVREGQADEKAALEAVQVLDSLMQVHYPTAGGRQAGRFSLAWTVTTDSAGLSTIDIAVQYPNGSQLRTANFRALSAAQ